MTKITVDINDPDYPTATINTRVSADGKHRWVYVALVDAKGNIKRSHSLILRSDRAEALAVALIRVAALVTVEPEPEPAKAVA